MLSNRAVADIFAAIADSMELLGEDRFRALAYRKAANAMAELPLPLADYRARGALDDIPGVGKTIADKIGTVLDTGTLPLYERLRAQVPPGVIELLRVPEIGPRSARRLQTELGITSLDDLRAAIESGKLRELKGFGGKTEARILAGLNAVAAQEKRMLMSTALAHAEPLLEALRAMPGVRAAAYGGSLRRARPTIGDIDLVAAADDPAATIAAFTKLPQVAQVFSQGGEKANVQLHSGTQVDLLAVEPRRWGSALQHFSSGQAHSIHFRNLALARGLSFSEHGFLDTASGQPAPIPVETEEQVYAAIGLPLIPPELREDKGEFEAALEGRLPQLVELSDIRGDLHMHSTWSDGRASVAAMAEAARARGYQYMAIADHSAYLGVTGGLDAARLLAQAEEVRALNEDYAARGIDFRVLRGIEVDITPDGSLALPDEALAALDIVVASPHVSLRQERAAATARLLKAIANPHVDIIGHPTGRLLERREGSDLDFEAVLAAAAERGTLLEVNSGPDRLDLDAIYARRALELGCTLTINSDAHAPGDLAWMRLGVLTARRGWASAERVANTWPLERLLNWLQARGV
jgi:DNA polymerase (family 10)